MCGKAHVQTQACALHLANLRLANLVVILLLQVPKDVPPRALAVTLDPYFIRIAHRFTCARQKSVQPSGGNPDKIIATCLASNLASSKQRIAARHLAGVSCSLAMACVSCSCM